MLKKVLLTGASGFLGQMINKVLANTFQVYSLGRTNENNIVCNLSEAIPQITLSVDIVIHAAGKAHIVPKTKVEEEEFFKVNYEGTKNLCIALANMETKLRGFIFISTVAVYGLDEGELINEDYPLKGQTPYAQSKIMAEQWLQNWAEENEIILTILRLPLIVGANPPGNLGAMIRGIRTSRYFSIGKASAKKSMVWAEDVAKIIPIVSEIGGVYNLTDGYTPTFAELEMSIAKALKKTVVRRIPYSLAKLIAYMGDILGKGVPINSDKLKKITSTLTFDDNKAQQILNWKPTPVLSKIIDIV